MPNELQRIEILDALAMHFTSSCDEETSRTAFHLLFPYGPNISPLRENFLILLVELALCLGLAPILDLAAIRLKAQIHSAVQSVPTDIKPGELPIPAAPAANKFVRRVISETLSIPGLSASCRSILQSHDLADITNAEHPLLNLPRVSPLFTSALVSGITLLYLEALTHSDKLQRPLPPPVLLELLLVWLRTARLRNSRSDWTSVDWELVLSKTSFRFIEPPVTATSRTENINFPLGIADAWPPARGLCWWIIAMAKQANQIKRDDLEVSPKDAINRLFSELHCEFLECFSFPPARGKFSRGGGSGAFDFFPVPWRLQLAMDLVPLTNYLSDITFTYEEAAEGHPMYRLAVLRFAELVYIAWMNDRLVTCDADEVRSLLKPFTSDKAVKLICSGLQ
ncbi:unnamed protein product [Schistocephalus solidus]|uniref:Fungal_trans domain-containing protein n=3 Tax=Schistocephalus solidus TaxID=70667 RepID=A0A183S7I9_SCHSO|nr:unnamed protein product [Schistocephalus solidus]